MAETKEKPKDGVAVKPKYFEADSAAEIAKDLIDKYHPHLKEIPIFYLFNDGNMNEWATMQKRGDKEQFISAYMFVMEINFKQWSIMSDKERLALVDHELCHATIDEKGKPALIDHDVEEFGVIAARYGLWRDSVRQFGLICADQLQMSFSKQAA